MGKVIPYFLHTVYRIRTTVQHNTTWNPSVTIQNKAIEQYFHVVLYYAVQGGSINFFKSVDETLSVRSIKIMKAKEQYFHVVLFLMLYKVVLTFKSVDENLVCDHSN